MSTNEPLNTAALQAFIQQVKSADASRAKELRLPIDQCKNIAFTLGIVMSRLSGDLEKIILKNANKEDEVISINVDGGKGW